MESEATARECEEAMVRFATEDVLARMEVLRRHAPPSLFDAWLRHEGLAYHRLGLLLEQNREMLRRHTWNCETAERLFRSVYDAIVEKRREPWLRTVERAFDRYRIPVPITKVIVRPLFVAPEPPMRRATNTDLFGCNPKRRRARERGRTAGTTNNGN